MICLNDARVCFLVLKHRRNLHPSDLIPSLQLTTHSNFNQPETEDESCPMDWQTSPDPSSLHQQPATQHYPDNINHNFFSFLPSQT